MTRAKTDPPGLTVGELIAELQKLDPSLPVVGDDHSEMGVVTETLVISDHYDNGGYISFAYGKHTKAKCRPVVYIAANRTGRMPAIPIPTDTKL